METKEVSRRPKSNEQGGANEAQHGGAHIHCRRLLWSEVVHAARNILQEVRREWEIPTVTACGRKPECSKAHERECKPECERKYILHFLQNPDVICFPLVMLSDAPKP